MLRIGTGDGTELRVWWTRRLLVMLWPNLVKLLGKSVELQTPTANLEAQKMITGMRHESHLSQADFATPFAATTQHFPLGSEPLLVARVDLSLGADNMVKVAMKSAQGAGVDVNMNEALVHILCKLLQTACLQADWAVELVIAGVNEPVQDALATRVLN